MISSPSYLVIYDTEENGYLFFDYQGGNYPTYFEYTPNILKAWPFSKDQYEFYKHTFKDKTSNWELLEVTLSVRRVEGC